MTIEVNQDIQLQLIQEAHAPTLFALVDSNRKHLKLWLPWVDSMLTEDHFKAHIRDCIQKETLQTDRVFVIMYKQQLAGRISIQAIDKNNFSASIGYWLGEAFVGKGIILQSLQKILVHCFESLRLNRIEIRCASENSKSQAIPKKLFFIKEGILREGEWHNGAFQDLFVFSLLKSEWKK